MFCIYCKGNHQKESCPLFLKAKLFQKRKQLTLKQDIVSQSPAPFVGHYGYPNVNVGILSPFEFVQNAWEYDAPRHWSEQDYNIDKIMDFRSSLLNSRHNIHIKSLKLVRINQEIGMSSKPVDLEINLKEKPKISLKLDSFSAPRGIQGNLNKARIISNPKIAAKVEKIVSDTDLKAVHAITQLYQKGLDENFITKNLSIGNFGIKKNRKLVPTKWSITATDDILAKDLRKQIQDYPEADYQSYFGGYLGNYYIIMFFPDIFRYELFETALKYPDNIAWDYENHFGRKEYAFNTQGGYYACRLGILEKLKEMKRQASALVLRFITGEYTMPLGVWVCREATRKALASKPVHFNSKNLMLDYCKNLVKNKFGFYADIILRKSRLLKELTSQKRLRDCVNNLNK